MSYAREMAQMKAKLVEKEAQLLGGFGSPEKLQDGAWTMPPYSPLNISPQNDRAFNGELQFGFGGDANQGSGLRGIRCAAKIAGTRCSQTYSQARMTCRRAHGRGPHTRWLAGWMRARLAERPGLPPRMACLQSTLDLAPWEQVPADVFKPLPRVHWPQRAAVPLGPAACLDPEHDPVL